MKKWVLVTGGAGYIGSHACIALIDAGYHVVILDNYSNSYPGVLHHLQKIVGFMPVCVEGNICDEVLLHKIFSQYKFCAVMHFAGLKAVGESLQQPILYYQNNIVGTIALLKAMAASHVTRLIFSSSATVYGNPVIVPIPETANRSATNPYGASKLIIEDILEDFYRTAPHWSIARLRYFNPIGAHKSGYLGDKPQGVPSNLLPYIAQVAAGIQKKLYIYGCDYPTPDGTCIRDYIHVMDLVQGHVAALHYCLQHQGLLTVNLGTGCGTSVLQMISAFGNVSQCNIPYEFAPRRAGDVAQCFADTRQAFDILGFHATYNLQEMCEDSWRFQRMHG